MDIMDLAWRATGSNVLCPQVLISARVCDSQTQTTNYEDLRESEGRQVYFPDVMGSLSQAERQKMMQAIVDCIVQIYIERNS